MPQQDDHVRCWSLEPGQVRLGSTLAVSFQRTRQVNERNVMVPPSYGALPIAVDPRAVPSADLLVPMDDEDGLWIGFVAAVDRPVAVRIAIVTPEPVDAVTGGTWTHEIAADPQNYIVCPPQTALHGVQATEEHARQFVRRARTSIAVAIMRLELTSIASRIAIDAVAARPTHAPAHRPRDLSGNLARANHPGVPQTIIQDPHGLDFWSGERCTVSIALTSPEEFSMMTGEPRLPPLNPADTYRGWRLP